MEIVVDSSVISKWYLMERYSEEALKLRGKYVTGEL
jgi:predicted nucleic acid-binding protein